MSDVTETCAAEREKRTADHGVRDDLDAEDIGQSWATIIAKRSKDQIFPFLIENQDAG